MKCVKCGNDCGNRLYCPYCGWSPKPGMENCLERERELQSAHQLYCPRCLSTNICIIEEEYRRSDIIFDDTIPELILGLIGELAHALGRNKKEYRCQDCDNKWLVDP